MMIGLQKRLTPKRASRLFLDGPVMHYDLSAIFLNIRGKFCNKIDAFKSKVFIETDSGYPKEMGVTLFNLTTLGNLLRQIPIDHLYQSPPSPIPGDPGRGPSQ